MNNSFPNRHAILSKTNPQYIRHQPGVQQIHEMDDPAGRSGQHRRSGGMARPVDRDGTHGRFVCRQKIGKWV